MKVNSAEEIIFHNTLADGDVGKIKSAIASNSLLLHCHNYRNFGATPLTSACFANQHELVELLLDLGADPNQTSDWEMGPWSPLHCAVYRHECELAKRLLSRGATMDAHTAAGLGLGESLTELLDGDPERVHQRGGDGCFPLHFADTVEVAGLLLARGADLNGRCLDHYSTAVQYLCKDRPEVARFLLSRGAIADVFSTVLCRDTSRLSELLRDNPKLVDARINQQFFPPSDEHDVHNILTFTVGQDATPLHAAACGNCDSEIPILIAAGAQVNARGGYDLATPLHLAAWNGSREAAAALLKCDADINAKSGQLHNNSPAGWAIVAGADRVFELLLSRGAEIHAWFLDDATDACAGRFDQVSRAAPEARNRIRSRLVDK